MKYRFAVVGLVAALFPGSSVSPGAQLRPSDFAILFEFGLCSTDLVDTFKGVFVRNLGRGEKAITIPLNLSNESLDTIYGEIMGARFNEYPEYFGVQGTGGFAPAWHYRLETRLDGVTRSVTWDDGVTPSTPDADRLRTMFTRVIAMVSQHPDVRRVPVAPTAGCG